MRTYVWVQNNQIIQNDQKKEGLLWTERNEDRIHGEEGNHLEGGQRNERIVNILIQILDIRIREER